MWAVGRGKLTDGLRWNREREHKEDEETREGDGFK
jgi:hypothetical protein